MKQRWLVWLSLIVFLTLSLASFATVLTVVTWMGTAGEATDSAVSEPAQNSAEFITSTRNALRDGPPEQRIDILNHLAERPGGAEPFADLIALAIRDPDPEVAEAAKQLVLSIGRR